MDNKPKSMAVPGVRCPACRAEETMGERITSHRAILPFKPGYLKDCDRHLALWMAADRTEREKDKRKGRLGHGEETQT